MTQEPCAAFSGRSARENQKSKSTQNNVNVNETVVYRCSTGDVNDSVKVNLAISAPLTVGVPAIVPSHQLLLEADA
jgi:hypothetical protein